MAENADILKKKIYLDMNVYNRPFDNQSQARVKLETIATFEILHKVEDGEFILVWSFILGYENSLNPVDFVRFGGG